MCMYTYLSVCVWSAISKHFRVHLKCGTNSGSYFSCLIRRCTTALHGMLSSDTHLRQLLQHPPTPSSSPAVAIVCACLRAGQFFPLLPIIFTKKLHTKCATLQRPPSATSAAALPLWSAPCLWLLSCHSLAHFLCLNSHSQLATVEHRLATFWGSPTAAAAAAANLCVPPLACTGFILPPSGLPYASLKCPTEPDWGSCATV